MNSSNFRFVLDLHSTQSQISIPVTLGDTARVWYISLSDGGLPYIIEDGCLAKLEIKRPTGTFLEAFCPVEKNTTIKYAFEQNENTAAVAGVHDCSVTLYDAEGNKIGSPRFSMVVSERVINSDDINLTDDDITAINAMMAAEASRQAAETGRVNAEASRVTAETERADAETARGTAFEEAITNANEAAERASEIAATLENKLANGELNGSDGKDGQDGTDGNINTSGLTVDCDIDTATYVMTVALKDKDGNVVSQDTVDLPLETMVVGGDEAGGIVTLTLQNGNTITFDIGDLVDGLVSQTKHDQDIAALNARIDALGAIETVAEWDGSYTITGGDEG